MPARKKKKAAPPRRPRDLGGPDHPDVRRARESAAKARETTRLKKQFIENLKRYLGLVTQAKKATGISDRIYKGWLVSDLVFREDVEEVKLQQTDWAKAKLFTIANGGRLPDGRTVSVETQLKALMFVVVREDNMAGRNLNYGALAMESMSAAGGLDKPAQDADEPEDEQDMDDGALMTALKIASERDPSILRALKDGPVLEAEIIEEKEDGK